MNRPRLLLLLIGLIISIIGLVAILAPKYVFGSILVFLGTLLIFSGIIKGSQLILGKHPGNTSPQSIFFIVAQSLIEIFIGILLINHLHFSISVFAYTLGFLFIIESIVLISSGLQAPFLKSKMIFSISGIFTLLIGFLILIRAFDINAKWVGLLIGAKLLLFGGSLIVIALTTKARRNPLYITRNNSSIKRKIGDVFAGYFGGAFHMGVYVGNNEIVHYRLNNKVVQVPWDEFLKGRYLQKWEYPDIPKAPRNKIVQIALSQVGKKPGYNFFTNNCEHFAIYCISGGKTKKSEYTQDIIAAKSVQGHPLLGTFLEIYTRLTERVLFGICGMFGRNISLKIRKMSAFIAHWLHERARMKKTV